MKLTIRPMLFETNSSSTHSLVFCTIEQYEEFCNGNLYIIPYGLPGHFEERTLASKEEIMAALEEDASKPDSEETAEQMWDRLVDWYEIRDYTQYGRDLEYFVDTWTTPKGEEIVAFGEYGHD